MPDIPREPDFPDEFGPRDEVSPDEIISAAVAEARRHLRRNELKTNSALNALSDWFEKSELRRTDETKRLASSQERVASAVRDALGVVTNRLNHIESLVTEAPALAFEPIRAALGRLDERVSAMEAQGTDQRSSEHFEAVMDSLGKRLTDVVAKIDELAEARNRDPILREERIVGIEAKLGSILKQLTRPVAAESGDAPESRSSIPQAPLPAKRPSVMLRAVAKSGTLGAAIEDIRHKQGELGVPRQSEIARDSQDVAIGRTSLRAELGALAAHLQRLDHGRVDAATVNDLLSATDDVRRLLADPTMPRLAARLEQGVADLTRRVDALAGATVDRNEIAALTSVISEIRMKLSQPTTGINSSGVERRIEALSAKIDDVMREPLSLVGQHLADLSARLEMAREGTSAEAFSEMRAKLDRIAEQADRPASDRGAGNGDRTLGAIRDKLDHLAERLDRNPPGVDGNAFADLRDRFDRLSLSIEGLAGQAPGNDNAMLADVRDRLERLAERLDRGLSGINGHGLADLRNRLDRLSQSIEQVAERAPENDTTVLREVRDRLDQLARQLDQIPSSVDDEALADLRERIDRMSQSIENFIALGSSSVDAPLADLRDRLDGLARRLDTGVAASDEGAIAELRERLDRVTQSIEQSAVNTPERIDGLLRQIVAKMEVPPQPDPNPVALKALERQVAALGERLDSGKDSHGAIGELERSVTRLFDELAETKAAAIKAAQITATGANFQAAEADQATRNERGASGRDMLATLDQMNVTLERVMDRLSSLETRAWVPDEASSSLLRAGGARPPNDPALDPDWRSSASEQHEIPRDTDEAARADMSHHAESGKQSKQPYAARPEAGASNEPLEPGSGRPKSKPATEAPMRATKDPVASPKDAVSATYELSAGGAISSTMSAQALIAAARRAAAETAARQQAAAAAPSSSISAAKGALSTLRASAGAHRKPILLALIGLMVVFSAVGAGRLILGGENAAVDQGTASTSTSPSRAAPIEGAPAKPAEPAPADPATPGKQSSAPPPASITSAVAAAPAATAFTKIGPTTVAPAVPPRPRDPQATPSPASRRLDPSPRSPCRNKDLRAWRRPRHSWHRQMQAARTSYRS